MTLANFRRSGKTLSRIRKWLARLEVLRGLGTKFYKYIGRYTVKTYWFRDVHFFYQWLYLFVICGGYKKCMYYWGIQINFMSLVSGNNFVINIFSNCGEKLVKSFWYNFWVSIYLVVYISKYNSFIWFHFYIS